MLYLGVSFTYVNLIGFYYVINKFDPYCYDY